MYPNRPGTLTSPRDSSRVGEKRRREDEDDELLEKLVSKSKRSSSHSTGPETTQLLARAVSSRSEDGPKKIKLKFGPLSRTLVASVPKEDEDEGG